MNKKVLIIFLVVIAIFVSYFLVTKSDDISVPTSEKELCEEKDGKWFVKEGRYFCNFKFSISKSVPNFKYYGSRDKYFDGDEPSELFYSRSEEDQKIIIEMKEFLSYIDEDYEKEVNVAKKYCMENKGKLSNQTAESKNSLDSYPLHDDIFNTEINYWAIRCYFEPIDVNTGGVKEELCEEYGGEWLAKEIWDIYKDACEFVYLPLNSIPYYYSLYEKYFDGDEPNEEFYLQSEEVQRESIKAKKLIPPLREEYQNFRYYGGYREYLGRYKSKEKFNNLPEGHQIDVIKSRKFVPLLEEKYKKEINIAKKYCRKVGGWFVQDIHDYKTKIGLLLEPIAINRDHWVVRCYIVRNFFNFF